MNLPTSAALAAIATTLLIGASTSPAAEPAPHIRCHGQFATYVGTPGDDRLDDQAVDFGRHPVIALGGGDDELELGFSDHPIRSLVVCAGSGDDEVMVFESVGARAYDLDGESGSDWIGNADDPDFSDLPSMDVRGGTGDDHLRGANSPDHLFGGAGDDRAFGLAGGDRLAGDAGDDALFGLGSGDVLLGGQGADRLDGDSPYWTGGEDLADGGNGSDRCEAEVKRDCER